MSGVNFVEHEFVIKVQRGLDEYYTVTGINIHDALEGFDPDAQEPDARDTGWLEIVEVKKA